jgi:hypothetical protein
VPAVGLKDSTPGTPESVSDSRHKMFAVRNKASASSSSNKAAATAVAAAVDTTSSTTASSGTAAVQTRRGSATSRLSRSYSRSTSEA